MISKLKRLPPGVITVLLINLIIVTFWLVNNRAFPVHDFTAGARVFELHQAILDGHFPPRWSKNFGFGMGMPLFQFYAPLAFYVAEIFHLIGFSILTSLKLSYFLATLIGFWGSYLLGKKLTNDKGGLIAATAFTLAPYHAVNLYVRGALAEYWAISLMPASIYFLFNLLQKFSLKAYLGLTLSLAAIFLSHNVTTVTFMPFWLATFFGLFVLKRHLKSAFTVMLSFIHSLLIASFFLLPAFLQKASTRVESITHGFSQFQLHFIYLRQLITPNWGYGGSVLGIEDDMSFYLGREIILLAGLGLISLLLLTFKKPTKAKINQFLTVGLLTALFLLAILAASFRSHILWLKIPLAKFIQFPWRFLGPASFFLALLTGFSMLNKQIRKYFYLILALLLIVNGYYFRPEKLIPPGELYNLNSQYIQSYMSTTLPDYLPPNVDWGELSPPSQLITTDPQSENIIIHQDTTDTVTATINSTSSASLILNRFAFPNWQLTINDDPTVCHISSDFLYQCRLQAGNNQLQLTWSEKGINAISNTISLSALFALGLILLKPKLKPKSS